MSVTTFVPTIWSETLLNELSGKYVGVANCNREFEGCIKGIGTAVRICGINPITTFQYSRDMDMPEPAALDGTTMTLTITKSTAFNIAIDDLDAAQSSPNIMQGAMRCAADALAEVRPSISSTGAAMSSATMPTT